jgi:hypothetical protein
MREIVPGDYPFPKSLYYQYLANKFIGLMLSVREKDPDSCLAENAAICCKSLINKGLRDWQAL